MRKVMKVILDTVEWLVGVPLMVLVMCLNYAVLFPVTAISRSIHEHKLLGETYMEISNEFMAKMIEK